TEDGDQVRKHFAGGNSRPMWGCGEGASTLESPSRSPVEPVARLRRRVPMLRKTLFAIMFLLFGSTMALAGPFYVGASAGKTNLQVDDLGGSFSSSATTYKAFAGFRFMKFF